MAQRKLNRYRPKKIKPGFNVSPAHASQGTLLQQVQVYVMHNLPFFWLNKFGISFKTKTRRANVSETTPGYVFYFCNPELEFGWHLEQFIHWLYRWQNYHFWVGSGRSEWFFVFSPIVGTGALFICHYAHLSVGFKVHALLYFCPFVWLDAYLWLLIFWLARVLAYVSLGMGLIYLAATLPK